MSYRLDYGKRVAKCRGPKPCKDSPIEKGTLRCGTAVTIMGNTTMAYRHWGCVTEKVLANLKESFDEADEIDGFEDLREEDQEKVRKAFEVGAVADEDIPPTARKPEGEEEGGSDEDEKPKKKKKTTKRKKADDDDEEEEEKPKKKKSPAKKKAPAKKAKAKKEESEEEPEAVSSEEEKPKKKKKAAPKATKKRATRSKKEESEEEVEAEE